MIRALFLLGLVAMAPSVMAQAIEGEPSIKITRTGVCGESGEPRFAWSMTNEMTHAAWHRMIVVRRGDQVEYIHQGRDTPFEYKTINFSITMNAVFCGMPSAMRLESGSVSVDSAGEAYQISGQNELHPPFANVFVMYHPTETAIANMQVFLAGEQQFSIVTVEAKAPNTPESWVTSLPAVASAVVPVDEVMAQISGEEQ